MVKLFNLTLNETFYEINSYEIDFYIKVFKIDIDLTVYYFCVWLSKIDLKKSFNLFIFKKNHFRTIII